MSDIRKWFMKKHETSTGNGNASKSPTPTEKAPKSKQQVQEVQDFPERKKTSKYFSKDKQNSKDEMETDEVSGKRKVRGDSVETSKDVKPPPQKKIHKVVNDDESDEDEDFATTLGKKRTGSSKRIAQKIVEESDDDDDSKTKSNSKSAGRGRGAKSSSTTPVRAKGKAVGGSDEEDVDEKDVKSGGRGRGGRGTSASSRGRGGGGRGGFMNFGERKDPPHKGEKEVPEGAANCLDGMTFVVSGTLDSLEREEAEDLIKRHGGRVTGSVSKKTNYLLCDEDIGGRKSAKAKELGTAFLTEDGLFDMIRASKKSKTVVEDLKKSVDKIVASPAKKSPHKSEKTKQAGHGSAITGVKGLISDKVHLPWAEKYKPKVPNDIVGNQSLVKQLHDWLLHWNDQFLNTGIKSKGKKPNDSGAKKAVLLSGTPGIGKTTSAKLVSQMLGFIAIEVNASDSRGKADSKIQKGIGGSTSNSIKELVSNEGLSLGKERFRHPKTVLIMDEVDGMSAGDRGGVADLIASIKSTKIPIICICNDRYSQKLKSLLNYCLLLNYRKPTKQQMAKRLSQIANAESLQVNEIALEELAERVNGDMRMAINQLQYMSLSLSVIKFDDIKHRLQNSSKDEEISPFTAIDKLFDFNGGKLRMDERMDLSMSDLDLVPLLVQENYINYRPSSSGKDDNQLKRMNLLARASESISDSDIVNVQIRRYRQWQLSQIGSLASCIIPAALLHGQREILEQGERNFNRFGGWLGKNSTARKNYRLLEDLHVHFLSSRESNLGRTMLRLDYLTLLLKQLTDPLRVLPKEEAVEKVVEFMDVYSINMEDMDTIVELSKFKGHPNPLDGIQSAVKAALTRAYNKGSSSRVIKAADFITLPGMKKAPKKKRAGLVLEPADDTLAEENAEEIVEDEEVSSSDTEDPENSGDAEMKLQSDLQNLNSKAIKVEVELKSSGNSKGAPAGRGRGRGKASASAASTPDQKGGRGSGASGSKRKR